MVEDVEKLRTEIERLSFSDAELLADRGVEAEVGRSLFGGDRRIAELSGCCVAVRAVAVVGASHRAERIAGAKPVIDGLILVGERLEVIRADVAPLRLVGAVEAGDSYRKARVRGHHE